MQKDKSSIKTIIILLVLLVFFVIWVFTGVKVFTAKANPAIIGGEAGIAVSEGDYVFGKVMMSSPEYCEYTKLLSVIPLTKQHYYLIFNEDMTRCITVRADKSWENQFVQGLSLEPTGAPMQGYVKKLEDEVQGKLNNALKIYAEAGIQVSADTDLYIDCLAERFAIMKIVAGVLTLGIAAFVIIGFKIGIAFLQKKWVSSLITVAAIADMLLLIYLFVAL